MAIEWRTVVHIYDKNGQELGAAWAADHPAGIVYDVVLKGVSWDPNRHNVLHMTYELADEATPRPEATREQLDKDKPRLRDQSQHWEDRYGR